MARYNFIVYSNPTPGMEDEYNRWYDERHIPDVLAVPGFVSATRMQLIPGHGSDSHRYLAIYQLDCNDPKAALDDLNSRAGTERMMMSDAIDLGTVSVNLFQERL